MQIYAAKLEVSPLGPGSSTASPAWSAPLCSAPDTTSARSRSGPR